MKMGIDEKIKICTKCGSTFLVRKGDIGKCKDCGSTFYYKSSSHDLFENLTKLASNHLKKKSKLEDKMNCSDNSC